jgi:plasmid replication initiation protein
MKNITVAKANFLTEASYRITLQEQRLIISCLNIIDGRADIPKLVTVSASQYADNFGLTMKNAHRELYKAASKLYERSITVKDPKQTTQFRWIQKQVLTNQGEGLVTLTFTDEILKYISQLKGHFTSYKIHHVSNLKSVYSMRLYELLIQFKKTGERIIRVEDFRSLLGLEEKYTQYRDLKKWVITPAVKELNAKSNLTIELETLKNGRKVEHLIFNFKRCNQLKMDLGA